MELYSVKAKNFCSYEDLSLSLHKAGLVLIGGVNNDTEAADSNGSGKSTIFKAISWGLYGQTVDNIKGDAVIKSGEKEACVEIELLDGSDIWKVVRARTKGTPRVNLYMPDGSPVIGDRNVIQDKILDIVGLDFNSFRNTVLYGQGDSSRFAHQNTKDSERKSMLHKIIGTDILFPCHDAAKVAYKEYKDNVTKMELEVENLKSRMNDVDLESIKTSFNDFEVEREEEIATRVRRIKEYKNDAKKALQESDDYVGESPDVDEIESRIEELKDRANSIVVDEEAKNKLSEELKEVTKAITNTERAIVVKDSEIQIHGKKLQGLDGKKCPLCTSSLKAGSAKKFIEAENKEYRALKKQRKAIADVLLSLVEKSKAYNAAFMRFETLEKEKDDLLRQIAHITSTELMDAKIAAVNVSKYADDKKREASQYIASAKNELKEISAVKSKDNPYAVQLKNAKARYSEFKKALKSGSKALEEARIEASYYKFWTAGFSSRGLSSYILDSVMPFLTSRANYYLEILSDGDILLEFNTQRELKSSSGAMRDEIEISWSIEGITDYQPSGGQYKKIEIATDLALMDLCAEREGARLDILLFDEIFDGLDLEGSTRVIRLLQTIRKERGSIFVVSHESRVTEAFEKIITVSKEDGTAVLKVG